MSFQLHRVRQEIREVGQVGLELHLQIQQHVAQQIVDLTFGAHLTLFGLGGQLTDRHIGLTAFIEVQCRLSIQRQVTQGIRQRFVRTLTVFELHLRLNERHRVFAVCTLGGRIQLDRTVHIDILQPGGELSRHERQERCDLPFAGFQFRIHIDSIAYRHIAFYAHLEIIDRQPGSVERKMHRIEVHRHRCDQLYMQAVGVCLVLDRSAYIPGIQSNEHVVPSVSLSA